MMDEQQWRLGRVLARSRGVQIKFLIGKSGIEPAQAVGAWLSHQRPQIRSGAQPALATARPAMTPMRCARYSELAWISPFKSSGGVLMPLIAAAEKLPANAVSISACRNTPPCPAPVIATLGPAAVSATNTPTIA